MMIVPETLLEIMTKLKVSESRAAPSGPGNGGTAIAQMPGTIGKEEAVPPTGRGVPVITPLEGPSLGAKAEEGAPSSNRPERTWSIQWSRSVPFGEEFWWHRWHVIRLALLIVLSKAVQWAVVFD